MRVAHTEEKAHRGEVESGARAACACGPARECCGQNAQAKAHAEHGAHVRDAGGVKAQQLIESIRILRSPERRHPDAEGNVCGTEGKAHRGGRIRSARGVRVWPSSVVWAQNAQAEAHIEHEAHVRDAGGVKAQRLVESSRILPSGHVTQREIRVAQRRWHTEGGRIRSAHAACVRPSSGACVKKAQAEAHNEHLVHVCHAGGVKAQQLVESSRSLPSPKGHTTEGNAWHGDVAKREGRISSAR